MVHRLLQRFGFDGPDAKVLREMAIRMLRRDEMAALGATLTADEAAGQASDAYLAICANDEVRSLYEGGVALHEIPFSMRLDDSVVRGTIDCVIRAAGRITVMEFKTGRPRDEHRIQLDLYRRAAERLFPEAIVDARLVYSAAQPRDDRG
jgi:ATP-dependent exoDNAse (exonuclease V) beta subunit